MMQKAEVKAAHVYIFCGLKDAVPIKTPAMYLYLCIYSFYFIFDRNFVTS